MMNRDNQGVKGTRVPGRTRMLVVAFLACLLINPPLLEVVAYKVGVMLFGWPLHVIYLYLVWGVVILLAFWPVKKRTASSVLTDDHSANQGSGHEV